MNAKTTTATALLSGDPDLCALRYLARKGNAAGVTVALEKPGGDVNIAATACGRTDVMAVAASTWQDWQTKGWITLADTNDCWRLTARGRQYIRKRLCMSGPLAAGSLSSRMPARQAEASSRPGINPNESPAGWLARRRDKNGQPMISSEQLAAAERLRADFWFAGMSPRVTANWSPAATGAPSRHAGSVADMSDNICAAKARVAHAVKAVGPELSSILIDVCCHLRGLESMERQAGWPLRSGKIVLQLALTRLARHYGLLPATRDHLHRRDSLRHWGTADYRPGNTDGGEFGSGQG